MTQSKWFKQLVHITLLAAFLLPPAMTLMPKPAEAQHVWYFDKIEDPRLKDLVQQLKAVLVKLWNLFWSWGWFKHPRAFYRELKTLFKLWYEIITELFAILLEYIMDLEHEISNTKCANQSCTQMGNPGT